MGKTAAVVKTQYIYVNSSNRKASDIAAKFTLTIPTGVFHCDEPTQFFKITVQDFNAISSWYFVNETNNQFRLHRASTSGTLYLITIPNGNYRFKDLANTIETAITNTVGFHVVTVTWNSTKNIFEFLFDNDGWNYAISFLNSNPAYYIMGFEKNGYYDFNSTTRLLSSVNTLKTTLSENICLTIDNVNPLAGFTNVENKTTEVCIPSVNMMSIANNFAPNDVITFINQNDLFSLHIQDKSIETLDLSVRDEYSNIMSYFSDWKATLKIETMQLDDTYSDNAEMISTLKEIKEYVRYIFVGSQLRNNNPQVGM